MSMTFPFPANDPFARVEELMAQGLSYADAKALAMAEAGAGSAVGSKSIGDEASTITRAANGNALRRKHRRSAANGLDPLLEVTEEAFIAIYEEELQIVMTGLQLTGRLDPAITLQEFRAALKPALVFLRVSLYGYNASTSPLRQARATARWLAVWGRNPVEVHVERGISGMAPYDDKEVRVVFDALFARCEAGEFGTRHGAKVDAELVSESFSRFTRSKVKSTMCAEKMEHYGFCVQISDRMDEGPYTSVTDNANALVQAGIQNDLAWRSIKRLADEHQKFLLTSDQLIADYSQGYCHENEVAEQYTTKGIKRVTVGLRLVPEEKPVGLEIIKMTLAGIGQRQIERDFAGRGIRTRPQYNMETGALTEGNRWTNSSITKWLRRSTLCGYQFDPKGDRNNPNDYYLCSKIEPLTSWDEWWTVQAILDAKRDASPGYGKPHIKHRGSRVLGCELCGSGMAVTGKCYGCSWRGRGYSLDHPGQELPFADQSHATMRIGNTDRMIDEATITVIETLPTEAFVAEARVMNPTVDIDRLHAELLQIAEQRRLTSVKLDAKLVSESEAQQIGAALEARELEIRERIVVANAEPAHPLAKVLRKIGSPASIREWWYAADTDEEDQGDVIAAVWAKIWVAAGIKHTHTMDIERRMRFVAAPDIDVPPALIEAVRERVIAERLMREGSAGMLKRGRVEIPIELSETILGWHYREGRSIAAIGRLLDADPDSYPPLSPGGWYPTLVRRLLDAAYLRHPDLERPSKVRFVAKDVADMIDNLVPQIGCEMTATALNAANKKRPKTDKPWDYFSVYTVYHGGKRGLGAPRKMTDDLVTLAYGLSKLNSSLREISDYIFQQTGVRLSRGIISKRLAERKEAEARKLLAAATVRPPKKRNAKPPS